MKERGKDWNYIHGIGIQSMCRCRCRCSWAGLGWWGWISGRWAPLWEGGDLWLRRSPTRGVSHSDKLLDADTPSCSDPPQLLVKGKMIFTPFLFIATLFFLDTVFFKGIEFQTFFFWYSYFFLVLKLNLCIINF